MRNWLLILHILAAAAWIGGGLFSWYAFTQLTSAGSSSGSSVQILADKADRYFGPSAGLTLLTGLALVLFTEPWGWSDAFVLVGIAVFVFSAVWQPLVSSKVQSRLLAAIDDGGDVRPAMGAFHRVTVVDMGVLLVALWAMVIKLGA